jgi:hypothetical protein
MNTLTHDLSTLRNQMAQFPIAHYFYIGEPKSTLAGILPYLADLADRSVANGTSPEEQIAGAVLGGAVEDFAILVAESFLHIPSQTKSEVLLAYALVVRCVSLRPFPRQNVIRETKIKMIAAEPESTDCPMKIAIAGHFVWFDCI